MSHKEFDIAKYTIGEKNFFGKCKQPISKGYKVKCVNNNFAKIKISENKKLELLDCGEQKARISGEITHIKKKLRESVGGENSLVIFFHESGGTSKFANRGNLRINQRPKVSAQKCLRLRFHDPNDLLECYNYIEDIFGKESDHGNIQAAGGKKSVDYTKYTVKELRTLAKKRGLSVMKRDKSGYNTKKQLIAKLKRSDKK